MAQGLGDSGYVGSSKRYDPKPQICQCEQPWCFSGSETCDRCGKHLPERVLANPSRQVRS